MDKLKKLLEIKKLFDEGIISKDEIEILKNDLFHDQESFENKEPTAQMFKTIEVANQMWTTENLNVNKFANGDEILELKTVKEWCDASIDGISGWCYFNNNYNNGPKAGRLYNWYAVNDSRCLAPIGWRIPTDNDWNVLINYLGGREPACRSLIKNKTFALQKAGFRHANGNFFYLGEEDHFWSSTEFNVFCAEHYYFSHYTKNTYNYLSDKRLGASIRLIKS